MQLYACEEKLEPRVPLERMLVILILYIQQSPGLHLTPHPMFGTQDYFFPFFFFFPPALFAGVELPTAALSVPAPTAPAPVIGSSSSARPGVPARTDSDPKRRALGFVLDI